MDIGDIIEKGEFDLDDVNYLELHLIEDKLHWAGLSFMPSEEEFERGVKRRYFGTVTDLTDLYLLENICLVRIHSMEKNLNGVKDLYPFDSSVLENDSLSKSIRDITIDGDMDLSFLPNYSNLEDLNVCFAQFWKSFPHESENILPSNLRNLKLDVAFNISTNYLQSCEKLEELNLKIYSNLSDLLPDFSGLIDSKFSATLQKLVLNVDLFMPEYALDFSFLNDYSSLSELELKVGGKFTNEGSLESDNFSGRIDPKNVLNLSVLCESNLSSNLKKLKLGSFLPFECSFLSNCSALEELELIAGVEYSYIVDSFSWKEMQHIEGAGFLNVDYLQNTDLYNTIKKLKLRCEKSNSSDLFVLSDYSCIERLDVSHFKGLTDISTLLDYEFVRNGSLKRISLPDTIHWTKVENGKFVNTEVVKELKRRDIEVELPANFDYSPSEIEVPNKLYVVIGPSGAGKSTLINYLKDHLSLGDLKKTTTRPLRSAAERDVVRNMSVADFSQELIDGQILADHEFYGAFYGVSMFDLTDAYLSGRDHLLDFVDPEAALALRDANPGFVEVIMLLPSAELVEYGLTTRVRELDNSSENFETFEKEQKAYEAREHNIVNTRERMGQLPKDYVKIASYIPDVDHVICGKTYQENLEQARKIVKGV